MINHKVRYSFILELIKKELTNNQEISICEVGSGSQGIGRYLTNLPFTGVDTDFSDYTEKTIVPAINMKAVKADAKRLPFKNEEFDFVFSIDMVEHIQPKYREKVIHEILRISKKIAVIGFPCGKKALDFDLRLYRYMRLLHLKIPGWLEEHVSIPYPMEKEMPKTLHKLGYGYSIVNHQSILLSMIVQLVEVVTMNFSALDKLIPLIAVKKVSLLGSNFYRKMYIIRK